MANRAAQFRAENAGYPVKRRGRHFIEFDTGGRTTWIGVIEPMHRRDLTTEIDDQWRVSSGAWQWEMVSNDFHLHARSVLNAGDVLQWLDADSGQYVNVQPLGLNWVDNDTNSRQQIALPQAVTATASDNTLTWTNGYGAGRHFRYTSHPRRLLKELIIDSAANLPAPTVANPWLEVEFVVTKSTGCSYWVDGSQWDNSTLKTTANRIEVRSNSTGEVLWYFDAPIATDAVGSTVAGVLQLRRAGNTRYCTVRFPRSWVQAAVFPISVDPTFTDGYGGDVDTAFDANISADAAEQTTNYGSAVAANIGYIFSSSRRMVLKFNVSSLSGATISSATLDLTPVSVDSPDTLDAYNIASGNSSMTEDGVCWSYQTGTTAWAGSAGCSTATTDYNTSKLFDSIGSWAGTTTKTVTLTTARVQDWLTANYGLIIRSQNDSTWNNVQMATSDHGTSGYRPKLVVVYGSTRTVASVTGALKWVRTRTVASVTAAVKIARSRSVQSVTAVLLGTSRRTVALVTASLSLGGTATRTVQNVTAALRQGFSRTVGSVSAVLASRIGRPEADVSAGNWTAEPLWDKVNEP